MGCEIWTTASKQIASWLAEVRKDICGNQLHYLSIDLLAGSGETHAELRQVMAVCNIKRYVYQVYGLAS